MVKNFDKNGSERWRCKNSDDCKPQGHPPAKDKSAKDTSTQQPKKRLRCDVCRKEGRGFEHDFKQCEWSNEFHEKRLADKGAREKEKAAQAAKTRDTAPKKDVPGGGKGKGKGGK